MYANQSFYNGHWKNGKKHGKGVSVYKMFGSIDDYSWCAGDIFDGEFSDNMRHGACEYVDDCDDVSMKIRNVLIQIHVVQRRKAALRVEQGQVPRVVEEKR